MAPHIASASLETRVAMSTLAVKNCLAVLEGKAALTPVT
jgi:lactate dehydrogenase-like 2-hydroxyacid dehydrogenase